MKQDCQGEFDGEAGFGRSLEDWAALSGMREAASGRMKMSRKTEAEMSVSPSRDKRKMNVMCSEPSKAGGLQAMEIGNYWGHPKRKATWCY